jgi:hypothetical protein
MSSQSTVRGLGELDQMGLAVLLPWTKAEGSHRSFAESVFPHFTMHTSLPPKTSMWVSKPLLRASAFCTNINILYLLRQPTA